MIHVSYKTKENPTHPPEVDWCCLEDFNKLRERLCNEEAEIVQIDLHGAAVTLVRMTFPAIPVHPTREYTRYTGEMALFLFNNL